MWGILAFVCFLVALIISVLVPGPAAKYAIDFAFAGGCFVGLALARAGGAWQHGW